MEFDVGVLEGAFHAVGPIIILLLVLRRCGCVVPVAVDCSWCWCVCFAVCVMLVYRCVGDLAIDDCVNCAHIVCLQCVCLLSSIEFVDVCFLYVVVEMVCLSNCLSESGCSCQWPRSELQFALALDCPWTWPKG